MTCGPTSRRIDQPRRQVVRPRRAGTIAVVALPVLCSPWLSATNAFAQSNTAPPTVDPNRLRDNLENPTEPKPAPRRLLQGVPDQDAPALAGKTRFVWRGFRFEGAEALSPAELQRAWQHAEGSTVSLVDVFAFANAITRAYGKAGYALAFGVVPEQQIQDGIVRIRVVEGFIDKIVYTGDRLPRGLFGRRGPIARMAARIKASRPLKTADLERYLLLMNDLPGVTAQATLSPSPETVGGSILTLRVTRRRLAADYGYNSYMPKLLGTHVVGGSVDVNGILTGSDRARVGAYKSITSDAYWSVSGDYSTQLGANGLVIGVSALHSSTRPQSELLRVLRYTGRASSARVYLRYPLIRSRARNLAVEVSTGIANTDSELLGMRETRDRLRNVQASLTYSVADAAQGVTSLQMGVEKGLNVFGAGGNSRANGRTDYLLLNMEVQRLQPIARVAGGPVSASLSIQGQIARKGPLLSAAECSYGGRRYGRRFDAGELTGENCVLASLELRWNPPIRIGKIPFGTQLYGFVDGGRVSQKGPLVAGEVRTRSAVSAGAGIRANLTEHITGGFEASRVLRAPLGAAFGERTRVMGNLSFHF